MALYLDFIETKGKVMKKFNKILTMGALLLGLGANAVNAQAQYKESYLTEYETLLKSLDQVAVVRNTPMSQAIWPNVSVNFGLNITTFKMNSDLAILDQKTWVKGGGFLRFSYEKDGWQIPLSFQYTNAGLKESTTLDAAAMSIGVDRTFALTDGTGWNIQLRGGAHFIRRKFSFFGVYYTSFDEQEQAQIRKVGDEPRLGITHQQGLVLKAALDFYLPIEKPFALTVGVEKEFLDANATTKYSAFSNTYASGQMTFNFGCKIYPF